MRLEFSEEFFIFVERRVFFIMPAGDDSPFASAVFERSIPHRPHAHAAINPSAKDRLCAIFNINFCCFRDKIFF